MGIKLLSDAVVFNDVSRKNGFTYSAGFTLNSQVTTGSLTTRTSPGTNNFICYPFRPKGNFRAGSISIEVSTAGTGNALVFLFETTAGHTNLYPNRQVFNVSFPVTTTGVKSSTTVSAPFATALNVFTFKANALYWWAITYNCSLRAIPIANSEPIGLISTTVMGNSVTGNSSSIDGTAPSFEDLFDGPPVLASNILPNISLVTTTF